MFNNSLVRFIRSERSFPFWSGLLLMGTLVFYRAFGLEQGFSASGHSFSFRGFSYGLLLLIAFYLVEISFKELSYWRLRMYQLGAGLVYLYLGLNYFWQGQDWEWLSFFSLTKDYLLFCLLLAFLEFIRIKILVQSLNRAEAPKHFLFKDEQGRNEIRIAIADLRYIQSEGNYVELYYFNGKEIKKKLLRQKLKNIAQLYPQELVQVHRSYLVLEEAITEIFWHSKDSYLVLKDDFTVKVGASFKTELIKRVAAK